MGKFREGEYTTNTRVTLETLGSLIYLAASNNRQHKRPVRYNYLDEQEECPGTARATGRWVYIYIRVALIILGIARTYASNISKVY